MKFRDLQRDLQLLIIELMSFAPSILGHRHSTQLSFIIMNMKYYYENALPERLKEIKF